MIALVPERNDALYIEIVENTMAATTMGYIGYIHIYLCIHIYIYWVIMGQWKIKLKLICMTKYAAHTLAQVGLSIVQVMLCKHEG